MRNVACNKMKRLILFCLSLAAVLVEAHLPFYTQLQIINFKVQPDVMHCTAQKCDTVSYGFLYNTADVAQALGAIEGDCAYPENYNQTFLALVNKLFLDGLIQQM